MSAHSMHLVIGERVFPQIHKLEPTSPAYGAFLLGCVLADVNLFSDLDYRQTHFTEGMYGQGEDAFGKSCSNFLSQLDTLLIRPWSELPGREQAFVAGWLCHLATDESWKEFCWRSLRTLGIASWSDLPVPGGVLMTAYHVLSAELFADFPAVVSALEDAAIPNVLSHVSHDALARTWAIARPHALYGRTPESYFTMLEGMGKSDAGVQAIREEHYRHWEDVMSFIREQDDIESLVASAVERSVEVVPRLWIPPR